MQRLTVIAVILALALGLGAAVEIFGQDAGASGHRDAPMSSQDPAADPTDAYIFVSPEDTSTVTLIANFYPFEMPAGGPNFYRFADDVRYDFNIDNNGDAKPDIRYFFKFQTFILEDNTWQYNTGPLDALQSPNLTVQQIFTVWRREESKTTKLYSGFYLPSANVGCHSFAQNFTPGEIPAPACDDTNGVSHYEAIAQTAFYTIPNGEGKVFAGQRRDSFFADWGALFDLLSIRGGFADGGVNAFDRSNVQTIALQVPIAKLVKGTDPVIGFWVTTNRKPTRVLPGTTANAADAAESAEGKILSRAWTQVNRLGLPMVNQVMIPMARKDAYNASKPKNDSLNFAGPFLNPELATLFNGIYGVSIPDTPRQDLVDALLLGIPNLNRPAGNTIPADLLRLNTSTPPCTIGCSTLGVLGGDEQGFPNGRRLTDDVVDITERIIAGVLVQGYNVAPNNALGDGVNAPSYSFGSTFPYLASPLNGYSAGQ